ncbi:MAG: UDP-N-acetylglucosamine 2-epimerase (hydrolyzing) [Elusimicrobia bacterium]|nr:UDP-N-acetylglucosamine 2-epimerase (hydrolyzing) [Elusimicrobiota bacterium]
MKRQRRKICVVTGSRAEYGLMYWLMREIQDSPRLTLQLAVTGTHLSKRFGGTVRQICADGFPIAARIDLKINGETPQDVTRYLSHGIVGFGRTFAKLRPDIVVILGDRYESFAAAQAALIANIPIAHLHGGELTEGLIDEAIRHSITKMAHLHFVAAEDYRRRVIQLGESPSRVYTIGAVGLENIGRLPLLSRPELEKRLDLRLGSPLFASTYHPVTLSPGDALTNFSRLLTAFRRFPSATIVLTYANADAEGQSINKAIDAFVRDNRARVKAFPSLGQLAYLSLLKHCDAVVGNSSSGLIEAPSLGVPTVNIGDRQKGRLKAPSVIDCTESLGAISAAIRRALSPAMKTLAAHRISPYSTTRRPSRKIARILASIDLDGILFKRFHDARPT